MANLVINTAQNVNLDYKIVSVGERILAFFIDIILFSLYFFVVELITDAMGEAFTDRWTVFGLQQLLFLPVMFYSLYMHIIFQGQTVGKMILKIRVVRTDGSPAHWSHFFTRWMLRLVDIWLFTGSVGLLTLLFSEKHQRIGDMAAGTVVISTQKQTTISHTILEEVEADYQPTFVNVTDLTDKDVRLIKETFLIAKKSGDFKTMNLLRQKVATVLSLESSLYDKQFIETVLKDYNYYTQNM